MKAALCLVLHHHAPPVSPAGPARARRWLYDEVIDSALPLLAAWRRLAQEGVPFRVALAPSPLLLEMLADPRHRGGCAAHLEARIARLAAARPADEAAAQVYRYDRARLEAARDLFAELDADLAGAWRALAEAGHLELLAGAATHAVLPLMRADRAAIRAQIEQGVRVHQRHFGAPPRGFWLPEGAYAPRLDRLLAEWGLAYFLVDGHGITNAFSGSAYGVYAPVRCPDSELLAFGHDPQSTRGLPPVEGLRDVGVRRRPDFVRPYTHPDGLEQAPPLRVERLPDNDGIGGAYEPDQGRAAAERLAAAFVSARVAQARWLSARMDRAPVLTVLADAGWFGGWWHEGPAFVEAVCRAAAAESALTLTTPGALLDGDLGRLQVTSPALSARGGWFGPWVDGEVAWIHPYLHDAADRLEALKPASEPARRALTHARRELMLAQCSDWPLMMSTRTATEIGVERLLDHLAAFHRLREEIERDAVDETWLTAREGEWGWLGLEEPAPVDHRRPILRPAAQRLARPDPNADRIDALPRGPWGEG